jgi:enamine deaminase RidA (YjgF/YER057c/UK114 family)
MEPVVKYINPPAMMQSRAFSQAALVTQPAGMLYIGAQTPTDGTGAIVGRGDIGAQTEQVLRNIDECLTAANAKREDLVSWTINVLEGQDVMAPANIGMRWLGERTHPPLNSVVFVSRLGHPDWLLSIDAIAALPQRG